MPSTSGKANASRTVADLRQELRRRGLPTRGVKKELVSTMTTSPLEVVHMGDSEKIKTNSCS